MKRSPSYLKWVRTRPCLVCSLSGETHAHHVRMGGGGGIAMKPPDTRALPLCMRCHGTLHQGGERTFWEKTGIDPHAAILAMLTRWAAMKKVPLHALVEACELVFERQTQHAWVPWGSGFRCGVCQDFQNTENKTELCWGTAPERNT